LKSKFKYIIAGHLLNISWVIFLYLSSNSFFIVLKVMVPQAADLLMDAKAVIPDWESSLAPQ
jgi:hypothetical protein